MDIRKAQGYFDGTAALKVYHNDESHSAPIVRLDRRADARVSRESGNASMASASHDAASASLLNDARIAWNALGVSEFSKELSGGVSSGKAFMGVSRVQSIVFGVAVFVSALAVVLW